MIKTILEWFAGQTLRHYVMGFALLGAVVFVLWWDHLKIQQGRDETIAAQVAANAHAQAVIDKNAAENNLKLQVAYNASTYEPINLSATPCGPVPESVRLRVNAAGKTGKH